MKITAISIIASALAASVIVAPAADAAKGPYKNCAAFNKKYPVGIAQSVAKAEAAVARGMERPSVKRNVYLQARKANKRLGTPRDGVVCEVRVKVTVPTEVQGLTAETPKLSSPQTTMFLTWSPPVSDGNSAITAYEISDGVQVIRSTLQGPNGVLTSHRMTGLSAGMTYTFTVTAINSAGGGPTVSVVATTAPTPTPTPTPTPAQSATRYENCTAARAAGVTPIRRDTNPSLYAANTHLDRDKDGVACE